jgi:hypothetical protein
MEKTGIEASDQKKGGKTMMENERFSQWAIVELFGHTQIAGLVTDQRQLTGGNDNGEKEDILF